MLVALHPPEQSSGLQFTATSHLVHHPPSPEKADPLKKERRRRLLELTEEVFPGGRIPDPFSPICLTLSQDAAANHSSHSYRSQNLSEICSVEARSSVSERKE